MQKYILANKDEKLIQLKFGNWMKVEIKVQNYKLFCREINLTVNNEKKKKKKIIKFKNLKI